MSAEDQLGDRWDEEESGGDGLPEFILDPIGVARRRWVVVVPCFLLGIAVTVVGLIAWKPTYLAQATILITSQQIPEDFVRSTVREDSLSNINAMVGKVLSAENLSKLIGTHDLFPDDTDKPQIDLVNRLRSRIEMNPRASQSHDVNALVFEISYQSGDSAEAALVANALAGLFVEASLSRRNTQARQTTVFLRGELERDEVKLREQSRLVSEFRREHRGVLPEELETNLRKLDMIAARRESVMEQISVKENRITTLASSSTAAPTENQVLLGELRRELAQQTAVNTDDHPNVIALRDRIARLAESDAESGVESGTATMIAAERRDIQSMREQLARADAEVAELDVRIDRTPRVGEELAALEQKEQVLREDYLGALRKVEASELAESLESAQQGGQVSVLDPAQPPSSPVRPRWIVALAGLVFSGVLGVGVAALLELIDPVIVGARHVRKLSDVPVLGSLPYVV